MVLEMSGVLCVRVARRRGCSMTEHRAAPARVRTTVGPIEFWGGPYCGSHSLGAVLCHVAAPGGEYVLLPTLRQPIYVWRQGGLVVHSGGGAS